MWRSGGDVGVTQTPENTKIMIPGMTTVKEKEGCGGSSGICGSNIYKIGGGVKAFSPERRRE